MREVWQEAAAPSSAAVDNLARAFCLGGPRGFPLVHPTELIMAGFPLVQQPGPTGERSQRLHVVHETACEILEAPPRRSQARVDAYPVDAYPAAGESGSRARAEEEHAAVGWGGRRAEAEAAEEAERLAAQLQAHQLQACLIEGTVSSKDCEALVQTLLQQLPAQEMGGKAAEERAGLEAALLGEAAELTSQIRRDAEELERTKERVQELSARLQHDERLCGRAAPVKRGGPPAKAMSSAQSRLFLRMLLAKLHCT